VDAKQLDINAALDFQRDLIHLLKVLSQWEDDPTDRKVDGAIPSKATPAL
jgi:hypothetical protein